MHLEAESPDPPADPPPSEPYPNLKQTVLLMLLGWGAAFLAVVAVRPVLRLEGVSAVGNVVGIGAALYVGCRQARGPLRDVLSLRLFPLGLAPLLTIMGLSGSILGAELATLVNNVIPMPKDVVHLFRSILTADSWGSFATRAALLGLMAPVTEELFFRGLIQRGLVARHGAGTGIVVTSICFGVFHLIPWQAVGTAFVGVMLGVVVHRTGSIAAGMWVHAVWNLFPLLAISAARGLGMSGELEIDPEAHVPGALLVPAGLVFAFTMFRFLGRTERRRR